MVIPEIADHPGWQIVIGAELTFHEPTDPCQFVVVALADPATDSYVVARLDKGGRLLGWVSRITYVLALRQFTHDICAMSESARMYGRRAESKNSGGVTT